MFLLLIRKHFSGSRLVPSWGPVPFVAIIIHHLPVEMDGFFGGRFANFTAVPQSRRKNLYFFKKPAIFIFPYSSPCLCMRRFVCFVHFCAWHAYYNKVSFYKRRCVFFPAFLHDLHFYLHRGAFMDKLKFRRSGIQARVLALTMFFTLCAPTRRSSGAYCWRRWPGMRPA